MAFQFSEHFQSSAKLTFIRQFRLGHVEFSEDLGSWKENVYIREERFYPNFPVLIKSNGIPWDVANSYLLSLVEQKQPWEVESVKTRAKGLLAYLRFLEDAKLGYLHLPKNNREKAPYRFRGKLNELVYEGLSVSYASNCIRAVIDFYKHIVNRKIINEELMINSPYKISENLINYMNEYGFSRIKKVETTDISLKVPRSLTPVDRIRDGGTLRPLSLKEQKALKKYLDNEDSNTVLTLMIRIALTTGARLQTVCTIRIHHVDYLYSEMKNKVRNGERNSIVELSTGRFRDIDTKNGGDNRLVFSFKLIESLYLYSVSNVHKKRMSISFYGLSRSNYIFLSRNGNPFYTSKKEFLDYERRESYKDDAERREFIPRSGGSVDKLLKNLVGKMVENEPDINAFRFHDLRATFGMNLVRYLSSSGMSGVQLLVSVRDRMGHRDLSVTQRYLDFDEMINDMSVVTESYECNLFGIL